MRIEGMDAAVKAVAVPVLTPEQTQAGPSGGVKPKQDDNKEQAGAAGNTAKKIRIAADTHMFDKQLQQQDEELTERIIREAVERANRALFGNDRKFEITIHEKTRDVMIKVVDTRTNETIREIPPKKIVDLVVRLCEMAGILFDEKG